MSQRNSRSLRIYQINRKRTIKRRMKQERKYPNKPSENKNLLREEAYAAYLVWIKINGQSS